MNTIMENNFVFHSKQMLVKKITKELYVPDTLPEEQEELRGKTNVEHATTYIPYTLIEQLEAKKNKEVKQMLKLPSNIKSEVLVLENQKTKELR